MMRKIAARTAAVVVALVAGAASYQHIAAVALAAGEPQWVAYSLPFAIDGLIVVGVAALLEDKAANLLPRRSAWAAVVVGVAATLAANVASAEPTVTARLVAAAAPIAFLISVEVLTRSGRPRPATSDTATDTATTAGATSATTATGDSDTSATATSDTATTPGATGGATSGASTATATPSRRRQVSRQVSRRQSSASRVAAAVAAAPGATAAELAEQLGLSVRTVQRHRAAAVAAANGHMGGDSRADD